MEIVGTFRAIAASPNMGTNDPLVLEEETVLAAEDGTVIALVEGDLVGIDIKQLRGLIDGSINRAALSQSTTFSSTLIYFEQISGVHSKL